MSSVDIVVPCYNYARYLEGCVASILNQRDVELRVLIIDDCSPDDTPAVGQRLAQSDPRVTYVRNETNLGLIGTSNKGVMDWARADYVVLLSADDALTPGALARAAALMDAHPEIAMTYGLALMFSDEGPELATPDVLDAETQIIPGDAFIHQMCAAGNIVPTPTAVMRTSVQHRIGGYDPRFKHTSDMDTWMRAATAGPIGVVKAVQGLYRRHASNMSAAYQCRPLGDCEEVMRTCREFERRYAAQFPLLSDWIDAMMQRFAEEAIRIADKSFCDPLDETWRDSLAFAKRHHHSYWTSRRAWKFKLKRVLGRRLVAALYDMRRRHGLIPEKAEWIVHGTQYGWWPVLGPEPSGSWR